MVKIDKVKARINWLKDAVKMLVASLLVSGTGVSNLYLDHKINILYYCGLILIGIFIISIWILAIRINQSIKELGK